MEEAHNYNLFERTRFYPKVQAQLVIGNKKNYTEEIFASSAHCTVSMVKSWSTSIRFFLELKILRSFNLVNKNRLRNIFKKYVKNEYLWLEIEKMINCGSISISSDAIYNSGEYLGYSLLSSFLLNLYMNEFDSFVQNFAYKFNLRKDFYSSKNEINKSLFLYQNVLRKFSPIKLESNLNYSVNMRNLISEKYDTLFNNFAINNFSPQIYKKTIHYVRYLDSILFGLVSSRNFVFFLQKKVQSFLKSQLDFSVKSTNVFDSKENHIVFLGFNIKVCSYEKYYSSVRSFTSKKYFSKILFRLAKIQKRVSKVSLERFNSEFFINLQDISNKNRALNFFAKKKSLWYYIFQLEAVRSTRLNKLVMTDDKQFMVSSEISSFVRKYDINEYQKYSFNLYNSHMQIVLRDIIKDLPSSLGNSVLPVDLVLSKYLSEFKKKIILLYNEYSFETRLFENKLFNEKFYRLSVSSNIDYIYSESILSLKNSFFSNKKDLKIFVNFFTPSNLLVLKLKSLGFIHPYKNRPIGNARLLHLEDSLIIKSFGYIAYSILFWYKLSTNSSKLRSIVELLRESCFLTLCRKHNKTKNWAYNTYTTDLVIFQSLFETKSFFPTRKFMLNLSKEKILCEKFFFNEKFFLEL